MSEENKYTFENEEYRRTYWHTCSHVLAQAVKRLHPEVKLAIGPSIENGFYYDLDAPFAFTPEDLAEIEGEMRKICKEKLKLERFELPREEALQYMEDRQEPYKVELINDLPADAHISFYKQGEFVDLCAGPHLDSTGRIKGNAIKLTACNAAYWRGDSNRQTLQRIYGVAFPKKEELDAYLERIEEAKRRDHRKLGKELGLFMMTEEGPGFPFFLPKGMVLKNTLLDYWRQCHKRYGYVEISTPIILNQELWHRSGHWDHYKDNMYTTVIDGEDYAIKPMNCPGGMLVYKSEPHSYRDLPLRMAELGLVHRHEMSGALHGLFRVRCFTQDDAHIFMTPDQMKDEIKNVVKLFDEIYSTFGLTYQIELSTMPEDHMGDEKDWKFAEDTLQAASSPILPGAWSGTTTSTRCAWGTRTSSSPTSRSNTSAACTTTPPITAIPPGSAAAWISRASASSSSPQISPSATRKACASSATPSPPWTPSISLRGIAARFSRATPWISSGCR